MSCKCKQATGAPIAASEKQTPLIAASIEKLRESQDHPEEIPKLWPRHSRFAPPFVTDYGLPQQRFAWQARSNPNVKSVYETIYPDQELVVGLDVIFFNPQGSEPVSSSRFGAHADQNTQCLPSGAEDVFQSVLYVWDSMSENEAQTGKMSLYLY